MVRRRTCGRAATLLRESMLGAAVGAKPSTHTRAAKASRSCEHRGARCSESHANRIAGIEETGCLARARGQEGAASCSHLHESQRSSLLGDLVWGNDGVITGERNAELRVHSFRVIIRRGCKGAVLARGALHGARGRAASDAACSSSMEADRGRAVHLGSSGTAAPSRGATGGRGGLPAATADGLAAAAAAAAVVGRVGPCDAATPARHGGALAAHAGAGLWHLRHADVRCVWTRWRARPAGGQGGGRHVLIQCHRDHGQPRG